MGMAKKSYFKPGILTFRCSPKGSYHMSPCRLVYTRECNKIAEGLAWLKLEMEKLEKEMDESSVEAIINNINLVWKECLNYKISDPPNLKIVKENVDNLFRKTLDNLIIILGNSEIIIKDYDVEVTIPEHSNKYIVNINIFDYELK